MVLLLTLLLIVFKDHISLLLEILAIGYNKCVAFIFVVITRDTVLSSPHATVVLKIDVHLHQDIISLYYLTASKL